jgi:hypothetical protein
VTENRGKTVMRRLRGMSDDMDGQNRNGTWEALVGPASPDIPLGKNRKQSPLIRKRRRGKPAGWRMES